MKTSENPYLIPVHVERKGNRIGDSTLYYKNLKDITFDQFLEFFLQRLSQEHQDWHWLHARIDAISEYTMEILLGFCHEPEKIKTTQEMLYVFIHEKKLCEFLLNGSAKFDDWARPNYGDSGVRMLDAFDGMVSNLHKEFQDIQEEGKNILEPFVSYIADLNSGKVMKDIREFIDIFHKPLEIKFLFASVGGSKYHMGRRGFNLKEEMLSKYLNNSEGSFNKTEDMRYGIRGGEFVATFLDGDRKINIEDRDYMQGMEVEKEPHCLTHIPISFLIEVLGVSYEKFISELIPESHEPFLITLRIEENGEDSHKLSYTFEEPDADIVLEYVPEHPKGNGQEGYQREKMISRLRNKNDNPKGERNELQKSLIGKTKSIITNNKFVYQTKVRYFHYFFDKCQNLMREDFGRKLGELRYLAYLANELSFIAITTPLVFPKILPVEENRTEIVGALNPTLVLEGKSNVVPNTIKSDDKWRVQIITGPNQNGKSRFMDSIGLNQILFQAGWPIFAKEATMSPKTDLRVRYVHSGVGIVGESRFSNECKDILADFGGAQGAYPLFLVDEPYTGTNYLDAETLLKEMLRACSEENITIFLTTHFHGLIDFVSSLANGRNLHCAVGDNDSFTYKILEGSSIKSNALVVAEKAGVRYENLKMILQKKKERHGLVVENVLPADESSTDDLPF